MANIEERLKKVLAERGMTMKSLANEVDITEQGLGKMLKNNSMKVETLTRISKAVDVDPSYWFINETNVSPASAAGIGNVVGNRIRNRQSFRASDDDCPKQLEALRREFQLLQQLVAAKDEMIAVLKQR